jgi:hypothetical protein
LFLTTPSVKASTRARIASLVAVLREGWDRKREGKGELGLEIERKGGGGDVGYQKKEKAGAEKREGGAAGDGIGGEKGEKGRRGEEGRGGEREGGREVGSGGRGGGRRCSPIDLNLKF